MLKNQMQLDSLFQIQTFLDYETHQNTPRD